MSNPTPLAPATAVSLGGVTLDAGAQAQLVTVQVRVSSTGLDMSSDAGARASPGRISDAAHKACGYAVGFLRT